MPGLLPDDPNARARAIAWMFAALSTVEPPIVELEQAPYVERDKPWYGKSDCPSSTIASVPGWASLPAGSAMPTGSTASSAPATC